MPKPDPGQDTPVEAELGVGAALTRGHTRVKSFQGSWSGIPGGQTKEAVTEIEENVRGAKEHSGRSRKNLGKFPGIGCESREWC